MFDFWRNDIRWNPFKLLVGEEGNTGGGAGSPAGKEGNDDGKAADQKPGADGGKESGQKGTTLTGEALQKELDEARAENARHRTKNNELTAENERLKKTVDGVSTVLNPDKGKSPEEAAREATEKNRALEASVTLAKIEIAFVKAAIAEGIDPVKVDRAFKLLDTSKITYDQASGKIDGMDAAVKEFKKEWQEFFKQTPKTVGDTDTPPGPGGDKTHTPEVLALADQMGVSPDFAAEIIAKRKARAGEKKGVAEIFRVPAFGKSRVSGAITEK